MLVCLVTHAHFCPLDGKLLEDINRFTHSWITFVPQWNILKLIMLNWVELNLTELKLIKSMLTKCVYQKERNMLFNIHFLPTVFYLLDLLFFVYISTRSISQPPFSFSFISFHLLLLFYYILPRKSCFP